MVLLFVFGWSIAILMGIVNVLFQDTQHLLEVLLQILFYLTPIIYPPRMLQERHLGWLVGINPLAAFLDMFRQPILSGAPPRANDVCHRRHHRPDGRRRRHLRALRHGAPA